MNPVFSKVVNVNSINHSEQSEFKTFEDSVNYSSISMPVKPLVIQKTML